MKLLGLAKIGLKPGQQRDSMFRFVSGARGVGKLPRAQEP